MIKFATLRTADGHVYDLLKPGVKAKAGVRGKVEVLAVGGGKARVTVAGVALAGNPPAWTGDLKTPTVKVVIEQVVNDSTIDTKTVDVEVTGLPAAAAESAAPLPGAVEDNPAEATHAIPGV